MGCSGTVIGGNWVRGQSRAIVGDRAESGAVIGEMGLEGRIGLWRRWGVSEALKRLMGLEGRV